MSAKLVALCVGLCTFVLSSIFVSVADTCTDCHGDDAFRVRDVKLFDCYSKWKGSDHNVAGIRCVDCHGGDSLVPEKEKSHPTHLAASDSESLTYYSNIPITQTYRKPAADVIQISLATLGTVSILGDLRKGRDRIASPAMVQ